MRQGRKWFAFATAAVMSLAAVFSACGGGDDGDYVGTLKIGYTRAGYGIEFAEAWTEAYNVAHPDAKINFDIDDSVEGGYIASRLENNTELCDIFMVMETGWSDWARSGWIEPLDDLMEMENDDGVLFGDALRDEYVNFGLMDGKRYVLPQSGPTPPGFAYDETFIRKLGLPDPQNIKTVDQLRDYVNKINALPVNTDKDTTNDVAPFAWGGMVAGYWNSPVMTWWAQYDGYDKVKAFYDMETVDVYRQREGLKKALDLFREFSVTGEGVPKNAMNQAMSMNHVRMQNAFILNKAVFMVGVYGLQNETKKLITEDQVLRMIYPPFIEGAKKKAGTDDYEKIMISEGQDFMFVPAKSENKDLAKKFLLWISTNDMCREYTKHASFLAPYKYDMDNIEGVSRLSQDQIDVFKEIRMTGHIFSQNPIVSQLQLLAWGNNTSPYAEMVLSNLSSTEAINRAASFAESQWSALQEKYFGKN